MMSWIISMALLGMAEDPPGSHGASPPVRLGVFLASDPEVAAAMKAGAEAAAAQTEPRLTLIFRQAGPGWDGGARRVAALVYEDRVAVVVAPPDAREAHDAALVTTKSRTPVLHLSPDPRLRHNRVPWSFCLASEPGPALAVREATRRAVTIAARAVHAAGGSPALLLTCLKQQTGPPTGPARCQPPRGKAPTPPQFPAASPPPSSPTRTRLANPHWSPQP